MIGTLRERLVEKKGLGLRMIWDALVVSSHLSGGKVRGRTDAEMRGAKGIINFVFTGEGGGEWHLRMEPPSFTFHRGLAEHPRETVTMSVDDYFRLLTGKTSFMVAQMTGRLRIEGSGHAGIMVGVLTRRFQDARNLPGLAGRIGRVYTALATELSGTPHRFPSPTGSRTT